MAPPEVKVSIAEVCEVRGCGLEAAELLSLAAAASEKLPPCPKGKLFDTENVFITGKGNVEIRLVSESSVAPNFIPPEWAKGEEDEGAAAVFCMGAVMRAAGAEEASDVDLFSLVNILTVAHIGTRPTANRMGQMARNQLRGRDAKSVLMLIYEEIMGDEEENNIDLDDSDYEMDDDVDDEFERRSEVVPVKVASEYSEHDGKESRGASTSTSSGNSTQKDPSPFFDDDDHHSHRSDLLIQNQKQPMLIASASSPPPASPSPKPRTLLTPSPQPALDESHASSSHSPGSPLGNSTRLNETYIEEHSINMSFNRSFEDNFVEKPALPKKSAERTKRDSLNPFDDDVGDHGGTLSGRDPFEDEDSPELEKRSNKYGAAATTAGASYEYNRTGHRFSSDEEDEIVHAPIEEELPASVSRTTTSSQKFLDEIDIVKENMPGIPPATTKGPTPMKTKVAQEYSTSESESEMMEEQTVTPPPRRLYSPKNDRSRKQVVDDISEREDENRRRSREEQSRSREHVDAVVITEAPRRPRLSSEADEEEDETPIDAAFHTAIKERKASQGYLPEAAIATPPAIASIISPIVRDDSPGFERRNSLAPSRISGRKSTRSMRGKRKTRAVPEFYDQTRHASIRLKAPSAKKKKMTLMRVEQADVWVELLNGQRVEVSCRTDTVARDIFSLVVQHMNINEHVFFGLSVLRDGEHFFLEDHQRLEKFAPPGWKNSNKNASRNQYVLFLRFRFYPQILDFIKTDVTLHELYLQVRRDVIEERIQPKRDAAFELAALALQAEFGNRPPPAVLDYFDNQHYLAKRYCSLDDPKRLQSVLCELHSHYSGTKSKEAEHKFIQICQRHLDFGSHLHRVFRNKPHVSHGAAPFDPDTGATLWISILPKGICVYEEQGGRRELVAEHLWQDTQTLQFDKKKFVIVASVGEDQTETVFYTDHHSKSSYFVKFAASQHKFMMKMRQWKSTLRHENRIQSMPDVIQEDINAPSMPMRNNRLSSATPEPSPLEDASSLFAKMPPPTRRPTPQVLDVSVASRDRSLYEKNNNDETINNSLAERFEAASQDDDGMSTQIEVILTKDPSSGLGLTLVDGNLNSIQGVYVKLVADNGAGMKAGILVGDRIVAVEGTSLDGGDRHRAVQLVQQSGSVIRMVVARYDNVVRHDKSASRDGDTPQPLSSKRPSTASNGPTLNGGASLAVNGTPKGGSRTPPAPRRAANRRVRAVSDFGAIGDTLPSLDSENVINIRAISGLHLDESDEEKGEYRLPTTSMYAFDQHDEDEMSGERRKSPEALSPAEIPRDTVPSADGKRKYRYARKSNLDWADELEEVGEEEETDSDIINVELERNSLGSLGVQIASVNGRVCIKQLTAEPASSHPNIAVGDVLLYVNGESVSNKRHQEVVAMLRSGGSVVTLGLRRENGQSTLTAVLEKKPGGSLGLSLGKRTGSDGIFIRMIANDSAAAQEGTLRVGDRLVSLDGQSVEGLTPAAILEKLKMVQNPVRITVTREALSAS